MNDPGCAIVLDSLKRKIEDGAYRPEQKLPELDELARKYGVSADAVRQALDILEKEGYVVQRKLPAYFISAGKRDIILIVEDNNAIRDLLSETVAASGYGVITARDSQEAMSMIQSQNFKLVFLDLRLPGVGGIEILKKIKEIAPAVPVVVVSGNPGDLLASQRGAMWPEMVISKPFKISQIKEALGLIKAK